MDENTMQPVVNQTITVMEGSKDEVTPAVSERPDGVNMPNRNRRTYFIFASSAIAYVSSMYLAIKGAGDISVKVAESMMTFLTVVVPTYILGYSIDSSNVLGKIGNSYKKDQP